MCIVYEYMYIVLVYFHGMGQCFVSHAWPSPCQVLHVYVNSCYMFFPSSLPLFTLLYLLSSLFSVSFLCLSLSPLSLSLLECYWCLQSRREFRRSRKWTCRQPNSSSKVLDACTCTCYGVCTCTNVTNNTDINYDSVFTTLVVVV